MCLCIASNYPSNTNFYNCTHFYDDRYWLIRAQIPGKRGEHGSYRSFPIALRDCSNTVLLRIKLELNTNNLLQTSRLDVTVGFITALKNHSQISWTKKGHFKKAHFYSPTPIILACSKDYKATMWIKKMNNNKRDPSNLSMVWWDEELVATIVVNLVSSNAGPWFTNILFCKTCS